MVAALQNPFSIISRLDDIAQDVENLQLTEHVWSIINQAVQATGASHQLSERLNRVVCEYCGTANPVGEGDCIACGVPFGKIPAKDLPKLRICSRTQRNKMS